MAQNVDALVSTLSEPSRGAMTVLRRLVAGSHPDVTEHVKWNGPSFVIDGDDRISLGVARGGAVRAVLHRGAKVKSTEGFVFEDETGLVKWAALDRGVVTFADAAEVEAAAEPIKALCRRWFDATR
ncbi:DUF1801 domain-containing protein [Brevundimonas sp.]|uniref:DUF1801 domain-containing protein n=1 Tax=Brevundimonas sp. TaxID=1871086 RepID=UPI00286AEEB1|nr:DUF1801 domain-containing protein [Brevundimonas sp.]